MTGSRGGSGGLGLALVRRVLLLLVGLGIVATAFELATERHWGSTTQLVPWAALGALALGVALALRAGRRSTLGARTLASVVLLAAIYGVVEHVLANHDAGSLDQTFADVWDTLPVATQWWYAVTKTVGPAPTLAPGVLGQQAVLLLLATWIRPRAISPREV